MITTFLELFAIGGLLFWIALATIIGLLTYMATSTGDGWFTRLVLTAGLVTLFWPIIATLSGLHIAGIAAGYLVIGVVYSFIRWFNSINSTIEYYSNVLKKYGITDLNQIDANLEKIQDQVNDLPNGSGREAAYRLLSSDRNDLVTLQRRITPGENKTTFFNWIFNWPWFIVRFFTADLAQSVYEMCKDYYTSMVNRALRKNLS